MGWGDRTHRPIQAAQAFTPASLRDWAIIRLCDVCLCWGNPNSGSVCVCACVSVDLLCPAIVLAGAPF